jgi:uncharacterized protein YqcC (DUF446 family)
MMIKTTPEHISTLLADLAFELKSLNLWQILQPSAAELSSSAPFCCDTLAFEQWLQFIFIPKIAMMINQHQPLPTKISLKPMAEEAFKHLSTSVNPLVDVIQEIDKALSNQGKCNE